MFRLPPLIGSVAFLMAAVALSAFVYVQTLRDGYAALATRADIRLSQQNDKFLGQITRYQQLVNTISRHPDIKRAVGRDISAGLPDLLLSFALSNGANEVFVVDREGALLATSEAARNPALLGRERQMGRIDYVRGALNGGLGWSHGLEDGSDPRKFYFARAIFDDDGPVIGAVAVSVGVGALEFEWSFGPEPVAYFDAAGLVFVTNRPEMALLRAEDLARAGRPRPVATDTLPAIFDYTEDTRFGHTIWTAHDSNTLAPTVLAIKTYLPRIGLTGVIFQNVRTAHERAILLAGLTALSAALIGVLLWTAFLRRAALSRQLLVEEAANEQLEARVAERTEELRQTQKQLIAVNRLSALGEMAAGISHELNQPLGAIRTFAENGKTFLSRGMSDKAVENFDAQMGQVDRIGRIIKSLRAFARNEEQEISSVDLAQIAEASVAVSDIRLKREGITLNKTGLNEPVLVRGGQVRLQQVVVNILGNAIDAMEHSETKEISMSLTQDGETASLAIVDTGPGIEDPQKVFDPFYSTKDPGGSSGMGLGLSISHGLVGSFGGTLSCRNRDDGGAEFTITLPLWEATP